jgi:hypothetical protein
LIWSVGSVAYDDLGLSASEVISFIDRFSEAAYRSVTV